MTRVWACKNPQCSSGGSFTYLDLLEQGRLEPIWKGFLALHLVYEGKHANFPMRHPSVSDCMAGAALNAEHMHRALDYTAQEQHGR